MEISYSFDPKNKRIVLTSETTIQDQVRQIYKYLTINPNRQQVIYQTSWTLSDKDAAEFESQSDLWEILRGLEKDDGEESANELLNQQPEVQALIAQHYTAVSKESFNDSDLNENVQTNIINILNKTKFIRSSAISFFNDRTKFTVSINWFMDEQKYISFGTKADQNGQYEEIYPTQSRSLDIDPEEVKEKPEKFFDWLWDGLNETELKDCKAACLWLKQNMPELFMIRSENRIFMN